VPLTREVLEKRRAYKKRWYERNKERVLARTSAYQKADPERTRKYQKAWRDRNQESERLRAEKKNWKTNNLPVPTRPRPAACECCGGNGKRALSLDHCHSTGQFRGWLCDNCNLGIGKLGDSVEALQRALEYLKRAMQ
jgi:hypothetical protein